MHGSLDKPGETGNRVYRRWVVGVFAVPVFVVIALIGLALVQPAASNWISAAVQAEFAGSSLPQEATSTRLAQPTMTVQAVRLY
jgi:preprotein translocase subunit SecG